MSLLARFRLEHAPRPGAEAEGSAPASAGTDAPFDGSGLDRFSFPPSSPAAERSSIFDPPPPAQRRRERSDSAEATLEQESQQRCKRHCAIQVCKDFELAEDVLADFTEVNAPHLCQHILMECPA